MSDPLPIRLATPADAPIIVKHRRRMFEEIGHNNPTLLDTMDVNFAPWVGARLERGEYIGWFAVDGEIVVAGAGLWLIDWPPGPRELYGPRGHVLNVYTEPTYRRRGLARQMMTTIVDWCEARELQIVSLNASDFGRPLYASLGFQPTNEMRLLLDGSR